MARFNAEEEFSWISISDIMSGLMMVFLFVAVLYMINVEHKQNDLDKILKETGMNAQDQIHYYLIEEAKNILQNSDNSVSEIAYSLGFEYPQYFSKLFKQKTGQTPVEYRNLN